MTFDTHAGNARYNFCRARAVLGWVCASDSGLESRK